LGLLEDTAEQPANPEILFRDNRIDTALFLILAKEQFTFFRGQVGAR
jgi:hypothetical protein